MEAISGLSIRNKAWLTIYEERDEYYSKPEADAVIAKWQAALDEAKEETKKDRAARIAAITANVAVIARLEAEVERLQDMLFKYGAMAHPPCFCCGYNGPGYFQPSVHKCAARHHEALSGGR